MSKYINKQQELNSIIIIESWYYNYLLMSKLMYEKILIFYAFIVKISMSIIFHNDRSQWVYSNTTVNGKN